MTPECTSDFHRKGLSFKSQGHMSLSKPGQRAACPEGTGKVQSGGGGAGGRDDREDKDGSDRNNSGRYGGH